MSSEGTPSRGRTVRRSAEIYVPLPQRNRPEPVKASVTDRPTTNHVACSVSTSAPIRKGRGSFRADWGRETTKPMEPRVPRGRDFDATTLRRYSETSTRTTRPSNSVVIRPTINPEPRRRRKRRDDPDRTLPEMLSRRMQNLSDRMVALENPAPLGRNVQVSEEVVADPNDQLSDGYGERNDDSEEESRIEEDSIHPSSELADSSTAEYECDEWEMELDDENAIVERTCEKTRKKDAKVPFIETAKRTTVSADDYPTDGPTTALQVYDFPPTLRTHHIHEIFAEYEDVPRGGFRIHWVDDTTCILEFRSAGIAKRAYLEKSDHKMVRIKPYTQILPLNENHPDRQLRPVTTDAVVRRLVQGALGIRKNAREDEILRYPELDPLQLAKAHRKAEREKKKQRDEELEKAFLEK